MGKIIGYGEDSLTFWAISERRLEFLQELDDQSDPDDCLVFYRPSFGRSGGQRASFGEFDAILATRDSIYLIESKWDGVPHKREWTIKLGIQQRLRHRIFKWYLMRWRDHQGRDWSSFVRSTRESFHSEFGGKAIAGIETRLAENLRFVMGKLTSFSRGRDISNVLLFLHRGEHAEPTNVDSEDFILAQIRYDRLNDGYFIRMP